MNLNPVTLAIPMYFVLMGIELLADQIQRSRAYRLNDSLTNISCGIGQQAVGVFLKVFSIGVYEWVRAYLAIWDLPATWLNFILVFILADMAYYWAHRMSHEINLFWNGGHVVHHQSEEYNLSVALRQGWFQTVFTFPFYLPLAVIGFDTTQLVLASGLNTVYQFWIHTEKIGKLGILEWVMNTPSHHRVHHGRNPKYIDKNHAGVFIVWDRMFGTFQEEEELPTYGITTPVNSWNPVWVQFQGLAKLWQQLGTMPSFGDKLRLLFNKPGWQPAALGGAIPAPEVSRDTVIKYDTHSPAMVNAYVFFHYLLTLAGSAYFAFMQAQWQLATQLVAVVLIIWSIIIPGGLFERQRVWYYTEFLRLPLSTAIILYYAAQHSYYLGLAIILPSLTIASLGWLWAIGRQYFSPTIHSVQRVHS